MVKQNKQIILRICMVILMVTAFHTYSYGFIMGNYADDTFTTGDGTTGRTAGGNTGTAAGSNHLRIKAYIIQSAGYFLESHSAMLSLLNNVEMSDLEGLDYISYRRNLYRAIENMEMARLYYYLLKSTADYTPYNPVKIQQLVSFDYETFQKEKGLNATTFKKVRAYLGKGDVNGFFGDLFSRTEVILEKLYDITSATDNNQFPLQRLWDVNREYSECLMVGQYSAQVFFEIKMAAN